MAGLKIERQKLLSKELCEMKGHVMSYISCIAAWKLSGENSQQKALLDERPCYVMHPLHCCLPVTVKINSNFLTGDGWLVCKACKNLNFRVFNHFAPKVFFFTILPLPELLPVLRPLERYMMPTLDAALLCSSRVGSDLGLTSDRFLRSFVNWVSSFPSRAQCFSEAREDGAVWHMSMTNIAGPLWYHINVPRGTRSTGNIGRLVWTLSSIYPLSHHGWIAPKVNFCEIS